MIIKEMEIKMSCCAKDENEDKTKAQHFELKAELVLVVNEENDKAALEYSLALIDFFLSSKDNHQA